jgi:hypothetical protein
VRRLAPALPPSGAISLVVVSLALSLVASIGMVMQTASGPLMLAWFAIWAGGAGYAGYRFGTWFWPPLCAIVMLAMVMLWEVVYGRTSWASLYVFMLAVTYAVAASAGALLGTWLGKRRSPARTGDVSP